jgi:enterochelin esterase-like enzyme
MMPAQQHPPRSPEIRPDGTVTFWLAAPDARSVTVRNTSGGYADWPGGNDVVMTRDGQGVWSATIGPIEPEYYSYVFVVDGVQTLDPGNVLVVRDGARYGNSLRVPGSTSADYDVNDVPHGTLAQVWYRSSILQAARRMYVYTPPGYETNTGRYPVLYLLHGGGGDEEAWTTMGRAPQILDNLIAKGKARPMIVVMTNGNDFQSASQDFVPPPAGVPLIGTGSPPPAGIRGASIPRFPESLVREVIPFVDAAYRTRTDREDRAIAGLSMGGAQTVYTAFNNLDSFAWVASFSGGFPLMPDVAIDIAPPLNAARLRGPDISRSIDPAKFRRLVPNLDSSVNARLRLFYLAIGTEDGLITTHGAVKRMLDERGVRYTSVEVPGYAHEWRFWRICLAAVAQKFFQPASG